VNGAPGLRPADRPQSLTGIAFERIRDAIVDGSLAPGTRVSESMLGETLRVSKTPVREALLRLNQIGLVERAPGGLRVVVPDRDKLRHAYEVRLGLEFAAARLAAVRGGSGRPMVSDAACRSLQAAEAAEAAAFGRWSVAFHRAVATTTGNQLLALGVEDAVLLAFTLRTPGGELTPQSADCARQHLRIAEAIMAGDEEQAGRLMHEHISEGLAIALRSVPV
jgi:DNA-binding GntR family transcriptional regulator